MTDSSRDLAGGAWGAARMSRVAAPLRDQVSALLRRAIVERELTPGQRLVERELVDRLQVSRATIRESLRELEAEGLVTVIPQRGAVVASVSRQEAEDIDEARAAIGSLLTRRFVERASDEQVAALAAALAELRVRAEAGQPVHDVLAVEDRFYAVLTDGASSPVLTAMLASLQARVSLQRPASLAHQGRPAQMLAELASLVAAVTARDAAEAGRLCADHVRNAARTGLGELAHEDKTVLV